MSFYANVTTFGDKLFYTNRKYDNVTCCDYHGNSLWTFCNRSVLMSPLGISVDDDGYLFVVGGDSYSVVVISPDGKRNKVLYYDQDYPIAVHFDTSTNKLLVAHQCGEVLLFEVRR